MFRARAIAKLAMPGHGWLFRYFGGTAPKYESEDQNSGWDGDKSARNRHHRE
jgi:hypothetical protein